MSHNNVRTTKSICPVAALAREARKLENEISEADEAGDRLSATQLEERLNATRTAISHLRPKSKEGANFQLDLIGVYADAMCVSDIMDTERYAIHLSIQRMTSAIMRAS